MTQIAAQNDFEKDFIIEEQSLASPKMFTHAASGALVATAS